MSGRLRAAVVGTGFVGPFHVDGVRRGGLGEVVVLAGSNPERTAARAAALGVPVASVYAGTWAAVDEELVREGRLIRISTVDHLQKLVVEKKRSFEPRRASTVINEIVELILE